MKPFGADRAIGFLDEFPRGRPLTIPLADLWLFDILPKSDVSRTLAFAKANDLPRSVAQS